MFSLRVAMAFTQLPHSVRLEAMPIPPGLAACRVDRIAARGGCLARARKSEGYRGRGQNLK